MCKRCRTPMGRHTSDRRLLAVALAVVVGLPLVAVAGGVGLIF